MMTSKPDIDNLPGGWEPEVGQLPFMSRVKVIDLGNSEAWVVQNALSINQCNELIEFMKKSPRLEAVSIQGRKDIPDSRIGSSRTTVYSTELADIIFESFGHLLPEYFMTNNLTPTDHWQQQERNDDCYVWKLRGMSPMLRFMKYLDGGEHYAHYDAGYIYEDPRQRTLKSVVIYLTTNKTGATRFIEDKQSHIPTADRIHEDWLRRVEDNEVIHANLPVKGDILIFDHRFCHDVQQFIPELGVDEERIIIRGDLIYYRTY